MLHSKKGSESVTKGEEIYQQAMGVGIREGYPVLVPEHPFFCNLERFMTYRKRWIGTASDLVRDMKDPVTPPGTAAKLLHRYWRDLKKNKGIDVDFSRTNRKRIIELQRIP